MNGAFRDFPKYGHLYSRVDHEPPLDMAIPRATAFSWMNGYERQAARGPAVRYGPFMGPINYGSDSRNPGFPAVFRGWHWSPLTLWGASFGRPRFRPYPIMPNPGAAPVQKKG